jgi:hypothetical protein
MPKIPPSLQANYVNLPDEDLREQIGEMHEKLVRLKEKIKADSQLNDWKQKIREREAEIYRPDLKRLEMRLEAARSVAKMKGIQYE